MDKTWLEQQLAEGRSIESIAREVGKHPSTVSYWVKKFGLKSEHAGLHAERGGVRRERLEELVGSDRSIRQIAEELGLSATTVRYWLKRYGLETTTEARRAAAREELQGICEVHGRTRFARVKGGLVCRRCRAGSVTEWRRRAKQILVQEAGGCCALCGYDRCLAALQFHHIDPSTKLFGLGARGLAQALDKLRAEAAKCILLCANCHAEVEAGVTRLPFGGAESRHPA